MITEPSVQILLGDVLDRLREMPDESIQCVVTSPPYWGLRSYGVDGQMGQERTLKEHIASMVGVFDEVRRVLRKDGTCWVNYGDCYASSPNGRSALETKAAGGDDRTFRDKPFSTIGNGLKPKDLCMVPNRFAIAMQDAGWWVRSEIIWHKPNPMPESINDRPATAHEKIFLFTKSQRYWYDAAAVRTPLKESSTERLSQDIENQIGSLRAHAGSKTNGAMKAVCRNDKQRGHSRRHAGFNDRWDAMPKKEQQAHGANLKNVWTVATQPFQGAHFATFPSALIEPCIKAGCPRGGTVLDIFGGAGTTGLVAAKLLRSAVLIELNPEYAQIATARLRANLIATTCDGLPESTPALWAIA